MEYGLLGIALAPDFAKTGHIYLQYFPSFNPDTKPPGLGDRAPDLEDVAPAHLALHDQPRHEAAQPRLRGAHLRVRRAGLLLLPRRRRHGLRLRGQPLRDHRRHELVAGHRRLLGQQPRRQVPDRARTTSPSSAHCGTANFSYQDARRTAGNTNDYNGKMLRFKPIRTSRTARRQRSAWAAPTRSPTRTRPTARTCSTAPRAAAARPSPRSTRWACATRRGSRSTRRPTSRTRPGSAPTPARRARRSARRRTRTPPQITRAGNYGWPYCMGNDQAYRDRVPGNLRTDQPARLRARRPGDRRHQRLVRLQQPRQRLAEQHRPGRAPAHDRHRHGRGQGARQQPLVQPRQPGRANGCPQFPRAARRGAARRTTARTPTAAVPVRRARRATVMNGPVYRYDDDGDRQLAPLAGVLGRPLVPPQQRRRQRQARACCSIRRPTRTAASRSTPTACAARCRWDAATTWTPSSGPTARSTSRSTTASSAPGRTPASAASTTPAARDTPGANPTATAIGDRPGRVLERRLRRRLLRVGLRRRQRRRRPRRTRRTPTRRRALHGQADRDLRRRRARRRRRSRSTCSRRRTTTAPVTTAALDPAQPGPAAPTTAPVTVTLSATDEGGTGVDRTEYRIDGGAVPDVHAADPRRPTGATRSTTARPTAPATSRTRSRSRSRSLLDELPDRPQRRVHGHRRSTRSGRSCATTRRARAWTAARCELHGPRRRHDRRHGDGAERPAPARAATRRGRRPRRSASPTSPTPASRPASWCGRARTRTTSPRSSSSTRDGRAGSSTS